MREDQRNLDFLKRMVNKIYEVIKRTEFVVREHYNNVSPVLPEQITFVHAEEMLNSCPQLSPREREYEFAKRYGAIFVIGIGGVLSDGHKHDGRAPDYDDWTTPAGNGFKGLNGDIILWNPVLENAFEISSMGIRVNRETLIQQLEITGTTDRLDLEFHQKLMRGELPPSIGGGLGQSRLCMFYLRKAHIGEVQASIWPEEMIQKCKQNFIYLF